MYQIASRGVEMDGEMGGEGAKEISHECARGVFTQSGAKAFSRIIEFAPCNLNVPPKVKTKDG